MLPQLGRLKATKVLAPGLSTHINQVKIQFRKKGETCHFPSRKNHQKLKKMMQEWGVPSWERERVPLLYVDNELVLAVGYFINKQFLSKKNEEAYLIEWAKKTHS